jgi:hypothetical protein
MSRIGAVEGADPSATAEVLDISGLVLMDGSRDLAGTSIALALARGWNRPEWDS